MKKVFQTKKFKRYQQKRTRAQEKARSRRATKFLKDQKQSHPIAKVYPYYFQTNKFTTRDDRINTEKVYGPTVFSMINNPEGTIQFIDRISAVYNNNKNVEIILSSVRELTHDAVVVLYSIMKEFKEKGLIVFGQKPKQKTPKKVLEESGFFRWVAGVISEEHADSPDRIYSQLGREVSSEFAHLLVKKVSLEIWDEQRKCPGVYRVLIEAMANTNEHADPQNKKGENWFLSLHYDKQNRKVCFSFVDFGVGIFKSIHRKIDESNVTDKIVRFLNEARQKFRNDPELLELMMTGEINQSRTKNDFRGKGLPSMNKAFKRNQLSKLILISNKVMANLQENSFSSLNHSFSGTFIYWELSKENHSVKWNK